MEEKAWGKSSGEATADPYEMRLEGSEFVGSHLPEKKIPSTHAKATMCSAKEVLLHKKYSVSTSTVTVQSRSFKVVSVTV